MRTAEVNTLEFAPVLSVNLVTFFAHSAILQFRCFVGLSTS